MVNDVPHANKTANALLTILAILACQDTLLTQDFRTVYNALWQQTQLMLDVNNVVRKLKEQHLFAHNA